MLQKKPQNMEELFSTHRRIWLLLKCGARPWTLSLWNWARAGLDAGSVSVCIQSVDVHSNFPQLVFAVCSDSHSQELVPSIHMLKCTARNYSVTCQSVNKYGLGIYAVPRLCRREVHYWERGSQ